LPTGAKVVSLFSPSAGLWASDLNGNVTDVLSGFPATFKLAVPVAATPVMVIGPNLVSERNYAITQNVPDPTGVACNTSPRTVSGAGEAEAIEESSFTISAQIPLGKCPVYAIESPDLRRIFVLNRGDDTITVINSQNNTLDACTPFVNQNGQPVTCHPSLPLSIAAGLTGASVPALAGPVYAEYNTATSQLVVADYDGSAISVIDVSLDIYGNDSPTFGTTFTIPVGVNPASVTALYDGSRAYTANQSDGTVSEVNLVSHTLVKTLPVNGHPRTVGSVQNSLYGKVYVASPDSPYLTIIRTDQDIIDTTVLVQGNVVDVRVSTPNASQGNPNVVSRKPGFGQPCYLPPTLLSPAAIAANPAACATLP
jgi:DNA-binding beta-propeller fold protein YncE